MKLLIIIYLALIAIQDVKTDVSHLHKHHYLPPNPQTNTSSGDTSLVTYQPTAQQGEQQPSRTFLFGNVEITRSIPIASFTVSHSAPVQQAQNAAGPAYAQSPTQNTQRTGGSYNYPTPIGSLPGPQPTSQPTYSFEVQAASGQPQQSQTNPSPQSIVLGAAQKAIEHQQFAAPALAPAPASSTYNVHQLRYYAFPVYRPTQAQAQIAQTVPQSEALQSHTYNAPATPIGSTNPSDLQQLMYAQQQYSAPASLQPIANTASVAAPTIYYNPQAEQTYSTRDQTTYSSQPQQSSFPFGQPLDSAPHQAQPTHGITQQQVSFQNLSPASNQVKVPASVPQEFIEYRPSNQQRNKNVSAQETKNQQDFKGYLPPVPQTPSTAQEIKEPEQNRPSLPVPAQPTEQPSPNYQAGNAVASQPSPLPENLAQQQTYVESQYNQVSDTNNYAAPARPTQTYTGPAQATYSVSTKSQQTYLAPAQQSYYPANPSIAPPLQAETRAYLPPVQRQSNTASAPAAATISDTSQLRPELTQTYTPPSQIFPTPQSNVDSAQVPAPVQQINKVSVPAQSPQSSTNPVGHTYFPPTLNQVLVNQQIPASSLTPSQIGQTAPVNQVYSMQSQAQLSQQSYSAPAVVVGPAQTQVSAATPPSPSPQQTQSLPAQPSRIYLPPPLPTPAFPDPSVPSFTVPLPPPTSPFGSTPNAQKSSISQENYRPAVEQQIVPVKVTVLGPQTSDSRSIPLPQTVFQSLTQHYPRNSPQNQPRLQDTSVRDSSAPVRPQLSTTTSQDNSQNYGTVYGSNGGYIY